MLAKKAAGQRAGRGRTEAVRVCVWRNEAGLFVSVSLVCSLVATQRAWIRGQKVQEAIPHNNLDTQPRIVIYLAGSSSATRRGKR